MGAPGLADALGVRPGAMVAFTGGGGKTGAILRLVGELATQGWRVAYTTTTRILDPGPLPPGAACVAGPPNPEGKLTGLPPGEVASLVRRFDVVLVEADGSRGLPLKFPAPHEPVIPPATGVVVPVVGAGAIGRPLREVCHRWELAAAWLGCLGDVPVTPELAARLVPLLTRGAPPAARVVPLVNQWDACPEGALSAARLLLGAGYRRVVVGAVRTAEPVRAVLEGGERP